MSGWHWITSPVINLINHSWLHLCPGRCRQQPTSGLDNKARNLLRNSINVGQSVGTPCAISWAVVVVGPNNLVICIQGKGCGKTTLMWGFVRIAPYVNWFEWHSDDQLGFTWAFYSHALKGSQSGRAVEFLVNPLPAWMCLIVVERRFPLLTKELESSCSSMSFHAFSSF